MLHSRILQSTEERDSLRTHLAANGVFTSIHWPTHELVKTQTDVDVSDALWLEEHILCVPVSHDYSLSDMEAICCAADKW